MAIGTLTYQLLKTRLQIANCCAGVKGANIILKEKKGFKCEEQWEELDVQLALIDSIKCYIDNDADQSSAFDDTGLCLTTIQIKNILEKLSTMCPDPCTTYVNFSS